MVWRQRRILVGVAVDGKETRQQSRVIVPRTEIGKPCFTVGFFPRESESFLITGVFVNESLSERQVLEVLDGDAVFSLFSCWFGGRKSGAKTPFKNVFSPSINNDAR